MAGNLDDSTFTCDKSENFERDSSAHLRYIGRKLHKEHYG